MIEQAEAAGELTPGKIVLEASSGNTAIGLAMVCAVKGYQLLVTMSESASEERKRILKAYGAQILLTPGYRGTDGAIEEAYRLAREEPGKYVLVDQFNNEANWQAHYDGTGKEIWEATGGKVDVVVITMGTTGTLMGITRALRELNPAVRVIGVEPFKGHKIQGLKNMKESYAPGIFKPEELQAIVNVDDDSAYEAARRLAREEGIFVGMSAGAAMKVALDEARALGKGTVVALLPDGGERYLSTSLFVCETVPEPLRFYNTLPGRIEQLEPVSPGKVTIYSCGPSLDGPPDLGLCRRVVFSDVLRRYLEYRGYQVKHAMNLGDIDDRTVRECLKTGEKLREFTARWEKVFFESLDTLRVKRSHHYPKASEHVNDMVEQTRSLLEKGLAYEKLRSVYFRINSFPDYGRLSGIEPKRDAERGIHHLRLLREGPPRRLRALQTPHAGGVEGRHLLAHSVGQCQAGLARGVRLHGRAVPGPAVRHPHGQHRPDLSTRRQRDRHCLRLARQAFGQTLDALRSGDGRRQESESRGRQRPHLGTPAGTGFRRTDGPLLAARHALSHGAPLLRAGA